MAKDTWDGREVDDGLYQVVVNHEEQYSIWPAEREMVPGWKPIGFEGTKQECNDKIEELWTDTPPLDLRKKMEEMERQQRG